MPKDKFSCERYFPVKLRFSGDECAQFVRLARDLVHETLDEYAEYRTVLYDARSSLPMSTSVLDPLEWKAVHRQGDLTVYKDRKKGKTSSLFGSFGSSSSSNSGGNSSGSGVGRRRAPYTQRLRRPGGDYTTIESKSHIPTMLVFGHLRGRLNDTMYGAFADSDQGFRVRTSYLEDGLDDSKILYTFERASLEDPFRFCGLLWYVYGKQLGLRRRDNVLLVAMGTTTSKQGDRIGYTVMHSVDIPELRPLTQYKIERAYGSLVFVKRQLDDERVELFQKGFFTPMGDVPEFAIVLAVMKGMLRGGNATIESSLSKKLFWMMQDAARLRRQSAKSDYESMTADVTDGECGGGCRARLSSRSSKGTCMICRKLVCSNCRVTRKITLEVTAEGVQQKTLCFCALCVTIARNTSALTIATREVLEHEARIAVSSFRSTGSSNSTESPQAAATTTTAMTTMEPAGAKAREGRPHVLLSPQS